VSTNARTLPLIFLAVLALPRPALADAAPAPTIQDLARAERAASGARLYARTCAPCHGRSGEGDGPAAPGLSPAPRDFTQGQYRFRTTPTGALPRPEDLERTIRRGLPGSAMPAFDDLLSPGEIGDLVSYLYSLLPANRMDEALPDAAPVRMPETGGAGATEGRGLYLLLECWTCHGLDGAGRGKAARTLQDDKGKPIRPPDFRHDALKRGREPEDIVRTLVTGLNGTPMPSYDDAVRLAKEDVADLSSFSERLPQDAMAELTAFVRTLPSKAEVDTLDAAGKDALHDRALDALARYVLSLDRRKGFAFWMFHQRPEMEPRK